MTEQEVQALAQLLARAPMTQAEALWARALLARLPQIAAAVQPGDQQQQGQQGDQADEDVVHSGSIAR